MPKYVSSIVAGSSLGNKLREKHRRNCQKNRSGKSGSRRSPHQLTLALPDSQDKPPISNRGVKPGESELCELEPISLKGFEISIDWFAGTAWRESMPYVMEALMKHFNVVGQVEEPTPTQGYGSCVQWVVQTFDGDSVAGAKFSWTDSSEVSSTGSPGGESGGARLARPEFHLQISASSMYDLHLAGSQAMVADVYDAVWQCEKDLGLPDRGFKATRIDIAQDDIDRRLHPKQLYEWSEAGYLCKFRPMKNQGVNSEPKQRVNYVESLDGGATVYFGKRGKNGKGCFIRMYDKRYESQYKEPEYRSDAIRLEGEFSGEKSQILGLRIAKWYRLGDGNLEGTARALRAVLLAEIDFRTGDKKLGYRDRPRVKEWEDYVGSEVVVKLARRRKVPSQQFPLAHFKMQWGGWLAHMDREGITAIGRIIDAAIRDGKRRGYGAEPGKPTKLPGGLRVA